MGFFGPCGGGVGGGGEFTHACIRCHCLKFQAISDFVRLPSPDKFAPARWSVKEVPVSRRTLNLTLQSDDSANPSQCSNRRPGGWRGWTGPRPGGGGKKAHQGAGKARRENVRPRTPIFYRVCRRRGSPPISEIEVCGRAFRRRGSSSCCCKHGGPPLGRRRIGPQPTARGRDLWGHRLQADVRQAGRAAVLGL